MLNQTEMTVQLNPATIATLNEIAQRQQRSEGAVIEDALNGYLKYIAWFEAEVEKGLEDFRQGRFYTDEEVRDKLKNMGANLD